MIHRFCYWQQKTADWTECVGLWFWRWFQCDRRIHSLFAKKIDAQYEQKLIHTVRGVGYVMRENEWNSWWSRKKLRYGALDCKPPQWNHSRRKYRRYRNEFYFPISENIRGYRYIPFWYIFLILSQYRVILPSVFKPSTKM